MTTGTDDAFLRKLSALVSNATTEIIMKALLEIRVSPTFNDVLYHYTSEGTLEQILRNNELWTTPPSFLNDASEYQTGLAQYQTAIRAYVESLPECPFKQVLVELLRKLADPELSDSMLDRDSVYVACLSTKRDDLDQWTRYGGNGRGYAVGLRSAEIGGIVPAVVPGYAIYGDRRHKRFVKHLIEVGVPLYAKMIQESGYELTPIAVAYCLNEALRYTIPFLKNGKFASEREVRLMVPRHEHLTGADAQQIKYHEKKGVRVPHVVLRHESGRLPIATIVAGPGIDFANAKQKLTSLLKETGYTSQNGQGVRIVGSKIPYVP